MQPGGPVTATEWSDEASRLFDLGWINSDGRHTDKGRALRKDIELETDRNADPIALSLGDTNAERVLGQGASRVWRAVCGELSVWVGAIQDEFVV